MKIIDLKIKCFYLNQTISRKKTIDLHKQESLIRKNIRNRKMLENCEFTVSRKRC